MTAAADIEPSARDVWQMLLALARSRGNRGAQLDEKASSVIRTKKGGFEARAGELAEASVISREGELTKTPPGLSREARELLSLYAPLAHPRSGQPRSAPSGPLDSEQTPRPAGGSFVVAHLGQSLDGRIGPPDGHPEAITGQADVKHNHRMRALFDVCLVGAGTVCHDNPALTVRHVDGDNPVRVVVDPDRRLSRDYALFNDGLAQTLLLCRQDRCERGERHGDAEVVGVGASCSPAAVIAALRERDLCRVFIEGGGVTVSRFLAAGCLHRLQIAVSPFILGRGRPGIDLDQTVRLRPRVRRFNLGDDVLFECCFDDG